MLNRPIQAAFIASLVLAPLVAWAAPEPHPAESRAITLLFTRLSDEGLYGDRLRQGCALFFPTASSEAGWLEIGVHEKHDSLCGGDPQTAPALDHFRIHLDTGRLLWMDIVSGEYLSFESICRVRHCAKSRPPASPAQ
ncbi:hypothetical protein [Roseateles sp. P5_E7]